MAKPLLQIRLNSIKILSLSYFPERKTSKSAKDFIYNLRNDNKINFEEGLFISNIIIGVKQNKRSKNNFLELSTENIFEIVNMDNYPRNSKGEWLVIPEFFRNMNGIAISTARGIILSECERLGITGVLLPLFDQTKFINKGNPASKNK